MLREICEAAIELVALTLFAATILIAAALYIGLTNGILV